MARAIALRMLTGAPRSRHQLAEAMSRRGVEEAVAEQVLDRFTEVGLIDDAEYARILVRSKQESRGLARRALAMELRRQGIDDDDAQDALAQVDDETEEEAARALLARRAGSWASLDPTVRRRRAVAMLARKGYSSALAVRLVRELEDESDTESWDPGALDPD